MKHPVVIVEWLDACVRMGWTNSHSDADLSPVLSIGFLLYEDDKRIKIAQSNCVDLTFGEIMTIPQCLIIKRKTLRVGKIPRK